MVGPDADTLRTIAERAKAVAAHAYCRYSAFPVGAVVLTDDGALFDGCNVENASYGLTICAERSAVFKMIAAGKRTIAAVVIYTPTAKPTAPCGACRQVIGEFGPAARIFGICDGPDTLRESLADLLPRAFGPSDLG